MKNFKNLKEKVKLHKLRIQGFFCSIIILYDNL